MTKAFTRHVLSTTRSKQSILCIGLDPDPDRIPGVLSGTRKERTLQFCSEIIAATLPSAAAYKLNLAFFEALGTDGWSVLESVLSLIPSNTIRIADAKRGDIGNSARFYASALLQDLPFDAVTLSPYMGRDSVIPFLQFQDKGVFVLARTSNPGGDDFQTLSVDGEPLYQRVARLTMAWGDGCPGSTGFVVGATDLRALTEMRHLCPNAPFLVPGIGAQGGSPGDVVNAAGSGPLLVNSSRKILYASDAADFALAASKKAEHTRRALLSSLEERKGS